MYKIMVSFITIFLLILPSITQASLTNAEIQKEMILARHDVTLSYSHNTNIKLDEFFAEKITNDDMTLFEKYRTEITLYFQKRWNHDNLTKKEILYKYLLIRSHYELSFRNK